MILDDKCRLEKGDRGRTEHEKAARALGAALAHIGLNTHSTKHNQGPAIEVK